MDDEEEDREATFGLRGAVFSSFWGASFLLAILIATAIGFNETSDFGQPFAASREETLLIMIAIASWLVGVAVRRLYRSTHNVALGMLYGFLMVLVLTAIAIASVVGAASEIAAFPREWRALLHSTSFAEAFRNSLEYPWFVIRIPLAAMLVVGVIGIVYMDTFNVTKRR